MLSALDALCRALRPGKEHAMETIDAFGLQCPKPLMLAKARIDEGVEEIAVKVDNQTAVKNLSRLAERTGFSVAVEEIEGGWLVEFAKGLGGSEASMVPDSAQSCSVGGGCGYAVFVGKDFVGDGDHELGASLMKMALYTLAESGDVPTALLFMNAGVKLVAPGEPQVVESVRKLAEQGTEILVCGTCLDYFGVKDQLSVGDVSNMYDILGRMREAAKVITL